MPEDTAPDAAAAASPPPQMDEEQEPPYSSPIQPEPEKEPAIQPEPEEEPEIRPEPTEENSQPQIAEEKGEAEATRPESGEETIPASEAIEEDTAPIEIASEEQEDKNEAPSDRIRLEFPTGRVKRIMKLDPDINKINSEALQLVTLSAQLFLEFLAEASGEAAKEKKRKVVKLEHIRTATKRHRATRDFLMDELPVPVAAQPSDQKADHRTSRVNAAPENAPPAGTRRIDDFFSKSAAKSPMQVEES